MFLMSCLVAVEHECAHAFSASKLGYKLNRIVLMPFGAVIDGDLKGISFKDESAVALAGPICNLLTAGFFVALWWCFPDTYAYTDTACFSSLAIGLINLLPAYPLDGGRLLRCALMRAILRKTPDALLAERRASRCCRAVTFAFALAFLGAFIGACAGGTVNFSLLCFSLFLCVGALGNRAEKAIYDKMDFSCKNALERGVEIKRVAVSARLRVKDVLRYATAGSYLVLEVYDDKERKLFELSQNEFSRCFLASATPYTTLYELRNL